MEKNLDENMSAGYFCTQERIKRKIKLFLVDKKENYKWIANKGKSV